MTGREHYDNLLANEYVGKPKQMSWLEIGIRVIVFVIMCAFVGVVCKFSYLAFTWGWGLI